MGYCFPLLEVIVCIGVDQIGGCRGREDEDTGGGDCEEEGEEFPQGEGV